MIDDARKYAATQLSTPTTAFLALSGEPLPQMEEALPIGELVRKAAISHADTGSPDASVPSVLSGHGLSEGNRHGHAFYLAGDSTGNGRIDHVIVHAADGLAGAPLQALHRIRRLWQKGREWKVELSWAGTAAELRGSYAGPSRTWISVTPYSHPWFAKRRFPAREQIRRECRARCLPVPEAVQLATVRCGTRECRADDYVLLRGKRNQTQPDQRGSFWRLDFPSPITGPLALGFACHYGLGLFQAARSDPTPP
ncbi:MAG: type I-U CRISPR-associated protein Csb2 [Pseudomonadota bacterium]